jgi:hypothetical protein
MINEKELKAIENRCNKSTMGPWVAFIEGRDHESGSDFIMTGPEENRGEDIELIGAQKDDFDFIAHSKQDVPKLIAEIRRLRQNINSVE